MSDFEWDRDDPLGRCKRETRRANDALRDYWLMGPGRSLRTLCEVYSQRSVSEASAEAPPTKRARTLFHWSTYYAWQARIDHAKKILDDEIAQAELEARRAEVLGSGYALSFERVDSLKSLAELLCDELNEEDKRWLPDVKQIGAGEHAERVDIVRFNAQLIEQYRRTLDDIAAELGERVKGIDLTTGGKQIQVVSIEAVEPVKQMDDE